MEFRLEKKALRTPCSYIAAAAQQNTQTEINLPDYCGDIKKILKCIFIPGISDVSVSGETVTATGTAEIKLIYIADKDKLDCYEGRTEFSVRTELASLPTGAVVCARAKINYVNCRAISQRRVTVEGNIGVVFTVHCAKQRELPCRLEGCSFQSKSLRVKSENLVCRKEKLFDMNETLRVPQDKPPLGKILCYDADTVLDSYKAVSDKLLIKGQLVVTVFYLAEGDGGKTACLTHRMPISQIVDLPGVEEKSSCLITLFPQWVSLQRKTDSSSKGSLLEISAKVSALACCKENVEAEVIEDCYSLSHEAEITRENEELSYLLTSLDRHKTFKACLELSGADVASVMHIRCCGCLSDIKADNGLIKAKITATLAIFYCDGKGVAGYTEKDAVFEFSEKIKTADGSLSCDMQTMIRSIDYALTDKNKIEITAQTDMLISLYALQEKNIVRSVKLAGEKVKDSSCEGLALYFCQPGESLWDIAKSHNTTSAAICEENDIHQDIIAEKKMLIIPVL